MLTSRTYFDWSYALQKIPQEKYPKWEMSGVLMDSKLAPLHYVCKCDGLGKSDTTL